MELRLTNNLTVKTLGDRILEVLGAPFGGHLDGKDSDGEFFTPQTDFMLKQGETRPVIYYHGQTPWGTRMLQPEVIGEAKMTRIDEKGVWFEVKLGVGKLADRIWDAAKRGLARASSGAINYLVRIAEKTGEILTWPLAELSLIDAEGVRQPSNQLAAVNLKSVYANAEIELPQAFLESMVLEKKADDEEREAENSNNKKDNIMTDEVVDAKLDASAIAASVLAEVEAKQKAEAERREHEEKVKAEAIAEAKKEWEADRDAWLAQKGMPAYNDTVGKNSKSQGADEFLNWIRTGDSGAQKVLKPDPDAQKALQGQTDAEGGYLVPDDFLAQIIARREEVSWLRSAGVQIFRTSLDTFNIPIEDSEFTDFVVAAEEGAYDEDTPGFNQVAVTIHKFTKLTKVSEELLDDDATNLEEWMARRLGEKMARTEERYAAVGTGTGQPQGVFVGGTAGLTFDSTGQILAAEVPELFYKLQAQYRQNASWLCNGATEAELRGLRDTSNWVFDNFSNQGIQGAAKFRLFYGGRPIFNESNVSVTTTGLKTLLIGDFSYYALVERQGLVMQRNPFLYQANGQVGFFSKFRVGGAVMQAEAFQYGTMA